MTEGLRKNIAGFGHQVGPLASAKNLARLGKISLLASSLGIELVPGIGLIDRTPGIPGYERNQVEDDSDSVESFSRNVQG